MSERPRDPQSAATAGRTLDHAAALYDLLAPLMTLGAEARYCRLAIEQLALRGGETVLDVGCGTGLVSLKLARQPLERRPARVVGMDAAAKMVARAQRKAQGLKGVRFETMAAERLAFPDASFDAAVSTMFFHHVRYAIKTQVLEELHRVLKPGGRLVIVDVDQPTTACGRLQAWAGYLLFRQDEIRENIEGRLREAFDASPFPNWTAVSHLGGYITLFLLTKEDA